MKDLEQDFLGFRTVPRTGIIYVMSKAAELGFHYGHPQWANLGQGAPETGPLPGAPSRREIIPVADRDREYAPVPGLGPLREAIAHLYNTRYRRGMKSKYTAENVAISAGGRVALTRVVASLDAVNLGHFLPDYTAYEELLDLFRAFVPIPILLQEENGFSLNQSPLRDEIIGKGLGAILLSNPCNPTGQLLEGDSLRNWVHTARELGCALIFDEFYSHYLYGEVAQRNRSLSACAHVEDVDKDPVVVIDGLTKNWRYPGLRLSWTLAPKGIIRSITSAGSFLDGGAPQAVQKWALDLVTPETADREALAIQKHFAKKREFTLDFLNELGIQPIAAPGGTFYCFASLRNCPDSLQDGMTFFREALKYKTICVPGTFFDVNPGQRRSHIPSRLKRTIRISFGPPMEELERGRDALGRMLRQHGA